MLFIYDKDSVKYIQLNIDIEKQRKRLFSKYASNLAFLNIQTSKESSDRHRTFMNIESLRNYSYFSSFQFLLNKSVSKSNNKKS